MLYPYYVALWGTFGGMPIVPTLRQRMASADANLRINVYDGPPCPGTDFLSAAFLPAPPLSISCIVEYPSIFTRRMLTELLGTQDLVWKRLKGLGRR